MIVSVSRFLRGKKHRKKSFGASRGGRCMRDPPKGTGEERGPILAADPDRTDPPKRRRRSKAVRGRPRKVE